MCITQKLHINNKDYTYFEILTYKNIKGCTLSLASTGVKCLVFVDYVFFFYGTEQLKRQEAGRYYLQMKTMSV